MEKENNLHNGVNVEISEVIIFGGYKYLHSSDEDYDYLSRKTEDGMEVTLQFTKDKGKHKAAMEAIHTFFSWL